MVSRIYQSIFWINRWNDYIKYKDNCSFLCTVLMDSYVELVFCPKIGVSLLFIVCKFLHLINNEWQWFWKRKIQNKNFYKTCRKSFSRLIFSELNLWIYLKIFFKQSSGYLLFRLSDRETSYYVRAGSNKPYQGGSFHKLTKIYMYNNTIFQYWFSSILHHDIALFEVRPHFQFSSTVQAVRLPTEFSKPPEQLYVCGWGYTSVQNVSVCLSCFPIVTPYEFRFIRDPDISQLWIFQTSFPTWNSILFILYFGMYASRIFKKLFNLPFLSSPGED